jgi:hemolysin III
LEIPVVTYSIAEERANTISHAIALIAGVVAFLVLRFEVSETLSFWGSVGLWIYGITLMLGFATSSIYHGLKDARLKFLFKKLDHISIYFLITGSYAVLILNKLLNQEGLMFLAALVAMTLAGIWFKLRYVHKYKVLSTVLYVLMGYIALLDPMFFLDAVSSTSDYLILGSGATYTVGAGFYLWKSRSWTHFIWHIFVIAAAAMHYAAVFIELTNFS